MSLLRAESLAVSRGDRVLLSGFGLELAVGGVIHLRGRNGVGKTSLLEVLAGLRPPASGRVERPQAGSIHWLGHRNALSGDLSAFENLRWWCSINGADPARIPAALERLDVADQRRRECRRLSAGQKRRVSLARLLIAPRPLWLLDEPLSGLDAQGLRAFGALLVEHLDGGGAAVISSHQALPARLARVTVMELG